jgi:putative methionine-R-sulfoxide reductase with GAF domain
VVDTFIRAYPEIAPAAIKAGDESTTVMAVSRLGDQRPSPSPLRQIRVNATETSLLDSYRRVIASTRTSSEGFAAAAQCLRQVSPATVFAFFRHDRNRDLLSCEHAFGDKQGFLHGLTMSLGTRVSGWSASTGRVSINAAASLDLANVADFFDPPLRSVLCTPVKDGDEVVGVLTAYSHQSDAFNEGHTYAFEQIACALRDRLRPVSAVDSSRQLVFRPRAR